MIRHKLIQQTVTSLLNEACVTRPKVDVEFLARFKGAVVVEEPLRDANFSGFLYRTPNSAPVIGVNAQHAPTRKRFTIAHELGHLLLHPRSGVHLDEAVVQMRDDKASHGTDLEEIEANRFAAELLMPRPFLEMDLRALGKIDADDEFAVANLAKSYGVSPQAMAIRLSSLNFLWL